MVFLVYCCALVKYKTIKEASGIVKIQEETPHTRAE